MVATKKKKKSLELFGTMKKLPDSKTIWHNTTNMNITEMGLKKQSKKHAKSDQKIQKKIRHQKGSKLNFPTFKN